MNWENEKRHENCSDDFPIAEQDAHQIIVLGIAMIVPHNAHADSMMDSISAFIEESTEAEILEEEREIR